MLSRFLSLIALLCFASALKAQPETPDRFQVYGGYSYLTNSLNGVPGSHQPLNGWDASMAFPSWHGLRFKIDVSSYRGTNLNAPQHPYYIVGGGQYSHRFGRETLFVEGMGGDAGANRNWGANQINGQTASFAALLGGGLDTRLTRHVAVRVNGDFQYTYFGLSGPYLVPYRIAGLPTDFGRFTCGLVWGF
jgi:hypothetical protein